jgi:hypothetical protein
MVFGGTAGRDRGHREELQIGGYACRGEAEGAKYSAIMRQEGGLRSRVQEKTTTAQFLFLQKEIAP